jgi:hypothetical protein
MALYPPRTPEEAAFQRQNYGGGRRPVLGSRKGAARTPPGGRKGAPQTPPGLPPPLPPGFKEIAARPHVPPSSGEFGALQQRLANQPVRWGGPPQGAVKGSFSQAGFAGSNLQRIDDPSTHLPDFTRTGSGLDNIQSPFPSGATGPQIPGGMSQAPGAPPSGTTRAQLLASQLGGMMGRQQQPFPTPQLPPRFGRAGGRVPQQAGRQRALVSAMGRMR